MVDKNIVGTIFFCIVALGGLGFQYSAYRAMPKRIPESVNFNGEPSEWRMPRERMLWSIFLFPLWMCVAVAQAFMAPPWTRMFSTWVTALLFAEASWLLGWFLHDFATRANGGRSRKARVTSIALAVLALTMAFGFWERYFK
jgi:hypothetical protein